MAKRAKAQSSQLLPLDAAMRCFARRESSVLMTSNIVFPSSIFFWVAAEENGGVAEPI